MSGVFYPIGRFLIVLAWLYGVCRARVRVGTFNWRYFNAGAASGGWGPAAVLILAAIVFDLPHGEQEGVRANWQGLIWVAPYAVISGLFAA